jgi:NitT/TauT family transport system substrate-binding protein
MTGIQRRGPMMHLIKRFLIPAVIATAGLFSTPLHAADKAPLKHVKVVLHWDHQAQFAGYYIALDKGFYAAEGLDVTIIRGGPDVRPCEMVADGKAEFCTTMLSTALEKRESGIQLALLAQVVNRSNFEIVTWKKPDGPNGPEITKPSDLNGRKVAIWEQDFRLPYLAFFEVQKIDAQVLPEYYSLSLFMNHGADACSATRYNEYHWLLQHGVKESDIVVFPLWNYGVPLPEDGIYALESTWAKDPAMCRAFARASLKGWEYAKENPDEALDAVMDRVESVQLPTNRPHMRWMLNEMLASIFPGDNGGWTFGKLSEKSYRQTCLMLKRHDAIQDWPQYASFVKETEAAHVEP